MRPRPFVTLIGAGIAGFVVSVISQILGAGLMKYALNIVDGKPASLGEVFAWLAKPQVITTAVIVAAITSSARCCATCRGSSLGSCSTGAMFYVVDKDLAPMDAIKESVSFATGHFAETLVFYLLGIVGDHHRRDPVPGRTAGRRPGAGDRCGVHLPPAQQRTGDRRGLSRVHGRRSGHLHARTTPR